MSKKIIKEAVTTYTIPATSLTIPQDWIWLKGLDLEEQTAFFQEIIEAIVAAQQSGDWSKLTEQIANWKKRAEANETQTLTELKQQFISEGGPPEVALLLGKYRGRLSSVEEFIRSKQIEKSLER
jgi:hypothetical protein